MQLVAVVYRLTGKNANVLVALQLSEKFGKRFYEDLVQNDLQKKCIEYILYFIHYNYYRNITVYSILYNALLCVDFIDNLLDMIDLEGKNLDMTHFLNGGICIVY